MIGEKTIKELALSAIPARVYFVLAFLAIFAATGMTLLSLVLYKIAPTWIAEEVTHYAQTFRAMPLWFLAGGSLTQFSTRLNVAIDDFKEWYLR